MSQYPSYNQSPHSAYDERPVVPPHHYPPPTDPLPDRYKQSSSEVDAPHDDPVKHYGKWNTRIRMFLCLFLPTFLGAYEISPMWTNP